MRLKRQQIVLKLLEKVRQTHETFLTYKSDFRKLRGRPNDVLVRIWENAEESILTELKEMEELMGQLKK